MQTWQIALLIASSSLAALLLIIVVVLLVKMNKKDGITAGKVKIKDGVRYSVDSQTMGEDGQAQVTYNKGDIILERGKSYRASKGGYLIPGKYTVLSADGGMTAFNLRVGGLVREYKHMSEIVVAEGEEITSVSHRVVLR